MSHYNQLIQHATKSDFECILSSECHQTEEGYDAIYVESFDGRKFELYISSLGFIRIVNTVATKSITEYEIEINGSHPEWVDSFIVSGYNVTEDRELTDEELDKYNEDGDLIYQLVISQLY